MKEYEYFKSCVDHEQDEVATLVACVENATDVTYETARRHCAALDVWAAQQGYERDKRLGLTLKDDWAVSYHRSTYDGQRCYYVRWSGIEFIWLRNVRRAL